MTSVTTPDAFMSVQLLCTKDAAKLMGLSWRTLEDWRLRGNGPCFLKLGRRVFYRVSDIIAFLGEAARMNTGGGKKN